VCVPFESPLYVLGEEQFELVNPWPSLLHSKTTFDSFEVNTNVADEFEVVLDVIVAPGGTVSTVQLCESEPGPSKLVPVTVNVWLPWPRPE
jgi:hypothetical protein